jgi:xanthine/uracil permease
MSPADSHIHGHPADRPVSALPSRQARALAFGATLVAGVCGALIGYSFVNIQCVGACSTPEGIGAIVGAVIAAIGVAVVSVLVLRAMGEWKTITQQRALEAADREAAEGEDDPNFE